MFLFKFNIVLWSKLYYITVSDIGTDFRDALSKPTCDFKNYTKIHLIVMKLSPGTAR